MSFRLPRLCLLVFAMSSVALGGSQPAHAQVPASPPSSSQVAGTVKSAGTYDARVNTPAGFFQGAGTYDARVTFTAAVAITGFDPASFSGSYQASGPFTATVTATGVPAFVVEGTYTASGTFASGTFTSSGQWGVTTGGSASGTHRGQGTYNLGALTAIANGQYDGTVASSPRGPFAVTGSYGGSGSISVPQVPSGARSPISRVANMADDGASQIASLTDMLAGIAGVAASGPVAATAIEMRNTATPPSSPTPTPATPGSSARGSFASPPTFGAGGLALVVFNGGSVDDLEVAAKQAGATGVWAQSAGGQYVLLILGAPAFVNDSFRKTFPSGFATAIAVTVTRGAAAP